MSHYNVWEKYLNKLAKDHRKDGLAYEADHLEKAVDLRAVVNEQAFRAVLAAVCWWDKDTVEETVCDVRKTADLNQTVEMVLRVGGIEVSRNTKILWNRQAALDLEAIMKLDATAEMGTIIAQTLQIMLNPSQEIILGEAPPFLVEMGRELASKVLAAHPLTEEEKQARLKEFEDRVNNAT